MVQIHRRGTGLSRFELHKLEREEKQNRAKADTEAVYEDFVKSFEVDEQEQEDADRKGKGGLAFVKGGTAFKDDDDSSSDDAVTLKPKKREIFLPPPMAGRSTSARPPAKRPPPMLSDDDDEEEQIIPKGSKKRNIDVLMEDIKKKQEQRDRLGVRDLPPVTGVDRKGSFDAGDPTTTNIFVGNLSPDIEEEMLLRLFGKYGPIASIKVMWPRTQEEFARGHVSGFVAFMERPDAEAAHDALRRQTLQGRELRLAWGKAVSRPPAPLPPAEGMTYGGSAAKDFVLDEARERADAEKEPIRISVPLDLVRRREINLLAAFIVKEGSRIERAITEKEKALRESAKFKFLFDPEEANSPEGHYYRWRVFSLLQGDKDMQWRTAPFAIVEKGPLVYPPTCGRPMNNPPTLAEQQAAQRSSSLLATGDEQDLSQLDNQLGDDDVKKLTQLLRSLTWQRSTIASAMVFCISQSTCAGDVASIIAESLTLEETPMNLKIARLFLVSDIIHNSAVAQVKNAWVYRSRFQKVLDEIFDSLGKSYREIDGRLTANAMRSQIERVLGAWERWSVYSPEVLEKYRSAFVDNLNTSQTPEDMEAGPNNVGAQKAAEDGAPLAENVAGVVGKKREEKESVEDEDIDGEPVDDIDGEPLDEIDGEPLDD